MAKWGKLEKFFYSKRGEMLMGAASGIFATVMMFFGPEQSLGEKVLLIFISILFGAGLGWLVWRLKITLFGNKLEKTVWLHGSAYGRTYEYECDVVSRREAEAIFRTRDGKHEIKLTPRYAGSKIGNLDIAAGAKLGPATVCAFFWDGEYAAPALFKEQGEIIDIWVHEY